ncbi:MAG: aldolase/citrate lyase family protein [Oscillospiraceae bacterium]|nr:aldolase/citrate lyase family protein [Oscillospiraceae bacterium]
MYARKNTVLEKLKAGEIVLGMENWLRDARVAELLGYAGFDFFHIENEHVGRDWSEVENMIRTAELMNMTPLYRTEQCFDNQPPVNEIIKAVKLGAQLIMVPQINTPQAAKMAADAVRLPPRGKRGIATCDRSMKEIFPTPEMPLDIDTYCNESNDEVMLWCIIETPEAVKNIDEILAVDGVDAVGFGHQDFAMAAGLSRDAGDAVDAEREKVWEATKRAGKHMWWNTDSIEEAHKQFDRGVQLMLFGCDIIHLDNSLRDFSKGLRTWKR